MGRPSTYSDAIADKICERIATSSDGLVKICEEVGITTETAYKWRGQFEKFADKYARARADQAQLLADEIVNISDETQVGEIVTKKGDGSIEIKRADMIEHRKLRIDARKWIASKLLPKKYGERVELEHSGELSVKRVVSDI